MKIIRILMVVALCLCLALAGCGGENGADALGATAPDNSGATAPPAHEGSAPDGVESGEPLPGSRIQDGIYAIQVSSNSSMFKIIEAQLTAANGTLTAVITLSGDGYEKLYLGTGEEALADTDEACIYFVEDDQGKYTYTLPVAALDQEINCAAWSIRKAQWYDRVVVFESALLPPEAILAE